MDDLTINISALQHYEYCHRKCGLTEVEGQWIDNRFTIEGQAAHRRVDEERQRIERGANVVRSLALWHDELHLVGRADVVEVRDGTYTPIEHKSGHRQGLTADVQLCAQALCLEYMFETTVASGFVWYGARRRRHRVNFDHQLRARTLAAVESITAMVLSGRIPEAVDDERCDHCQMRPRCLPEIVAAPIRARSLRAALLSPAEAYEVADPQRDAAR